MCNPAEKEVADEEQRFPTKDMISYELADYFFNRF
jgi:hypothetical protein